MKSFRSGVDLITLGIFWFLWFVVSVFAEAFKTSLFLDDISKAHDCMHLLVVDYP